jgi:prepilin-type N-terminal cleavage/methylation domain-containing protein
MLTNEKGFTLIEIIAVLVILGILAAVAIPKYISMMDQSRLSAAQTAIAEVKAQCSNYYASQMLTGAGTTTDAAVLASITTTPYLGPDYNVTAATAASGILITVNSVKGVGLTTAQTGTWYYPGM